MKSIQLGHQRAKEIKLGKSVVDPESRMNPDSSAGLFVNAALRVQARMVEAAKARKKALDKANKAETAKKNLLHINTKQEAFDRVKNSIMTGDDRHRSLNDHTPSGDLKLTYQHLGGVVSQLPNGRKETFVALLHGLMPPPLHKLHFHFYVRNSAVFLVVNVANLYVVKCVLVVVIDLSNVTSPRSRP
jgi:hypothetical protein